MAPPPTPVAPSTKGGRRLRIGIPFVVVHLAVLGVFFVGWSPVAVAVCVALYVVRSLGITVFYHRGFAHRAFTMPRAVRVVGAGMAAAAAQRGPLWWVGHHRIHHRYTDREGDPHSPVVKGMLSSHLLWLFDPALQATNIDEVKDLAAYPEMRLLDRFHHLVPLTTAAGTFALGAVLQATAPSLGTSGLQMLVWGFCVSTVALYHSTFAVNSVAHRYGRRPFDTKDASRNNWFITLVTLGEGWHNNHHRYPVSARQGFRRFELDPAWWFILALQRLGLVHDLRPIPAKVLAEGGIARPS